jgi:hypothetical protein
MKRIFLHLVFFQVFLLGKAQTSFFPTKRDTQPTARYQQYSTNLRGLYNSFNATSNKKEIAQLYINKASIFSLLGTTKDSIFSQLEYGYAYDSIAACRLIRHFNREGSFGFKATCMRLDSITWLQWCDKCNLIVTTKDKKEEKQYKIDSALYKSLKQIYNDDQRYRKNDSFTIKRKERRFLDSINLVKVEAIIAKYGYPGKSLVGDQSMTAFFVIQHADLETREKHLPAITQAVKNKELVKTALILLVDRIHMDKYNMQLWGTQQLKDSKDQYIPVPIDTSEAAQKLKKEVDEL